MCYSVYQEQVLVIAVGECDENLVVLLAIKEGVLSHEWEDFVDFQLIDYNFHGKEEQTHKIQQFSDQDMSCLGNPFLFQMIGHQVD